MIYIDLFSGIGGFALGAYWAGMKFDKHYFSEVDEYAIKVYEKRFPDALNLGDITKIDTSKLEKANYIITGGFPCQDISIAGKGAGIHGKRSSLWFEYWRLIRDLRPRFAIMENVGMLVYRGLRKVLGSLAEIGYNAEWQDIRAEDLGAPHKRERIWIVAYPASMGQQEGSTERRTLSKEIGGSKSDKRNNAQGEMAYSEGGESWESPEWQRWENSCRGSQEIPDTMHTGLQTPWTEQQATGITGDDTEIPDTTMPRLERQEPESRQRKYNGLPSECDTGNWPAEPSVGMLVNGLPDDLARFEGRLANKSYKRADQLKGLGNAIIPQIAELLFLQIKDYMNEK